jgi:hypothetical protein
MSHRKYDMIAVHRIVLLQKIGPGVHPCHWCGNPVKWLPVKPGKGGWNGVLVVDHVNNMSSDNDPDNLVPSCFRCNIFRQKDEEMRKSLFKFKSNGDREKAVLRKCRVCGYKFLARMSEIICAKSSGYRTGLYCSFKCQCAGRTIAFKSPKAITVNVTGGRGTNQTVVKLSACLYCGEDYYGTPSDLRRGRRYCSISCGLKARYAGFPTNGRTPKKTSD